MNLTWRVQLLRSSELPAFPFLTNLSVNDSYCYPSGAASRAPTGDRASSVLLTA